MSDAAPLMERIRAGKRLVCDGGMGSWLIAKGLAGGECPEAVNVTHPDWIREISGRFVEAGADIIETNTFGASPLKLAQFGCSGRTEELNERAVELAREAARGRALVAASCGPSGRILQPYGDTEPSQVHDSFLRQMKALAAAGIDTFIIETMTDLAEALLALEAAREAAPDIPALVTLTFDSTRKGFYTIMGNSIPQAAEELQAAGADMVGSNCGNGIGTMVRIAADFRASSALPLLIQSNAGLPQVSGGQITYPEGPELFEEQSRLLADIGVSIIGGCCGTTPDHIRAIARAVK